MDDEPIAFFAGLLWGIGAMALMYIVIMLACAASLAFQVWFFGG